MKFWTENKIGREIEVITGRDKWYITNGEISSCKKKPDLGVERCKGVISEEKKRRSAACLREGMTEQEKHALVEMRWNAGRGGDSVALT